MLVKLISYIPSIIGLSVIGLLILLNNPKDTRNRVFALLNFATAVWLTFLFLADISHITALALWLLRFGLFFGTFPFLLFFLFSVAFPFRTKVGRPGLVFYSLPLLVIAVLSFTNLVVPSVAIENYGVHPQNVGLLYTLSDLIGILYLLVGVVILLVKYRRSRLQEKSQLRLVLFGLSVAVITNIITNFVLTLMNKNTDAILLGGFSFLIFSVFVAYAILRHGFFSVRAIVARSAAYVLSLGSLAAMIFLMIYGVSLIADRTQLVERQIQMIDALFVVALALSYQSMKRYFDRVTNRLFYRDAYETQQLLGDMNRVLVATIDLEELLLKCSRIIKDYLKADHVFFVIRDQQGPSMRFFGKAPMDDIKTLEDELSGRREKIIVQELLDDRDAHLREYLSKHSIRIISRLSGRADSRETGYLFLGDKKSGALYTAQDIAAIRIIANELVIATQNALRFDEIKRFNVTLQEKIEEATKQLRHANHRLRELDATKDEFISMASHQLRTPLTTIKGYLSMVLEGDVGPVTKNERQMIQQAFDSAERMVFLIADLLNVSRLQSGKFVIENKPTDLAKMVEAEVAQLKETAENHHLTLTYKKPEKFPLLNIDENKIRQVVMNFMDNAIYYTPAGGSIEAALSATEHEVSYTVTDTGLGVPKSEQHHLFSKFYRAGNARKMRPDGTGLGLFMAKKVIAAQGGAIIFNSVEGKGSTFGFSFPRAKMEAKTGTPKAAAAPAEPEKVLAPK